MMADVAWLIDCDERWLDGAIPVPRLHRDQSAGLAAALPAAPWRAARALGLALGDGASPFRLSRRAPAALGAERADAAWRPRRRRRASASRRSSRWSVLPGETFCERDHLAAVFGVPLLAATLARAERRAAAVRAGACWRALAAGAMAAIKPPYALIGRALGALSRRARSAGARRLRAPEYYAAAAVGLAYVVCVGSLFPDYVARRAAGRRRRSTCRRAKASTR